MPWYYSCSRGRRGDFQRAVSDALERLDGISDNDDAVSGAVCYAQGYGSCQDIKC